jgi:orotate phosphoribosyltransferase
MGVILENDHFVFTGGNHGSSYFNKDAIYQHPRQAQVLYERLAGHYYGKGIEVIVVPAIGGVALEQNVARLFYPCEDQPEVIAIFAEDEEISREIEIDGKLTKVKIPTGRKIIRRGYAKEVPGKTILVLEDVLTTGNSARKVIEAVRELGGEVIGLGVICNRGNITPDQMGGVPIFSLLTGEDLKDIDFSTYSEEECPLCKRGIPVNQDIGKGREYLAEKEQQKNAIRLKIANDLKEGKITTETTRKFAEVMGP